MEKKRVLISVDSLIRDGYSAAYLKLMLERFGCDVRVEDCNCINFFTLYSFLPHVVIVSQVEEIFGATIAKYAKTLGAKVIVIPTEGAWYPKSDKEAQDYFTGKYTRDYNKAADLWLCWGEQYKVAFHKYTKLNECRFKICGAPRFDIYYPPLNQLFLSKSEFCKKYDINPDSKIITLPTHFPYAEVDLNHAKTSKFYSENQDYLKEMNVKEIKERKVLVDNFLKLAKELSGVFFILKVHPWESGDYYLKRIEESKLTNIRIIKNEYIGHIINNSDIWLHVNCTTAKEATFMRKPVITLAFLPEYAHYLDEFSKLCQQAKNYDEMLSKVKEFLKGKEYSLSAKMEEYMKTKYYKLDGQSTIRCAQEILTLIKFNEIKPKRVLPVKLISNVLNFDLFLLIKNTIYNTRLFRDIYLKLRWGKSKEYLDFFNAQMFKEKFAASMQNKYYEVKNIYSV